MHLAHIDTWLFDLDNTLYPAAANLFAKIDERMGVFIGALLSVDPDEAKRIQKHFFHAHGTTLRGLMDEHGVQPQEFLDFVHDIEMDALTQEAGLGEAIAALPGRKLVFTNGDEPYARRVLSRLGLADHFEAVFDIHAMAYLPKPDPAAYSALCKAHAIDPRNALFVEDMARNLIPAKAIGMTTVWLDNGSESAAFDADMNSVDYRIEDLGTWLRAVNGRRAAA